MVYWSNQNDLERWLSGRKQRFAKASYGLNRTEGSNPSLSAIWLPNRDNQLEITNLRAFWASRDRFS